MQGNVSPLALAAVLRQVAQHRQSGVLHVFSAERSARVRVSAGSVAEASFAGAAGLRDYLTRTGKIDASALERAVEADDEAQLGLARALVDAGAIDAEAMRDIVRARARGNLLPLFGWSSGEYRFEEGEGSAEGGVPADLSALEVILEGTRSIADADLVRSSLGDSTARLRRAVPDPELESARLSDSERSVLDLCRTPAGDDVPVDDVASVSGLGREETLKCIHTLVAVGALELLAAEPTYQQTTVLPGLPGPRRSPPTLAAGMIPERIGRYAVEEVLGWGSMGLVVSARDPEIDRSVAIKVIHSALQLDDTQVESYEMRFRQEAKAAGKLMHPGIVAVFDAGRNESGEPYLVMERVEGETLKERFSSSPATADECRELAGQILDARSVAHSSGVVHRDLKPQNVIVTSDGRAKLMDFGVAHVVGSELTQGDEMLGSPAYMAPEQLSGVPVDGRTDLFALGVVLYWMLTAKMPFEGDSLAAIVTAILTKNPVPPRQLSASVPSDLNDIVLRCLSKDPAKRFADAMEMKRALIGAAPIAAAPSRPPLGARRPFWGVLAAAALGAAVWTAFSWGRGESGRRETAAVVEPAPQMSQAERLYHDASAALDSGDLEGSHASLNSLIEQEPDYPGASELLLTVEGEVVRQMLPIELDAKHDHTMGSCRGRLTLADGRIEYISEKHGTWRWAFDQIVYLESKDSTHLELKTGERDMLKLGGSKRYRFELSEPIDQETWSGFRTLANR